jgi:hypothetical protein
MQARRRAGLRRFPLPRPQGSSYRRQVRNSAPNPGVLGLKILQTLRLIAFQPPELLPPAIIGNLRYTYRANGACKRFALLNKNIHLTQIRDDLFRLMTLPRHADPPSQCQKTYFKVDPFNGGGES